MAIKYVDIESEGEPKRAQPPKARPALEADGEPAAVVASDLPHAKPAPKPRGRKKPLR